MSEVGEWYELSETERLRQQENAGLRAANASLNEEIARLRQQLATVAISTPAPGDVEPTSAAAAAAEEPTLPTGA